MRFWRELGGIKLAGVAGPAGVAVSGVAVVGLIALLLLLLGRCNFLFHPVASVRSTPTPTSSSAVGSPTPSADATSTPTPTGTPTPTATGTPTPTTTSTPTPTAAPTATPTPAPQPPVINLPSWSQGEVGISYPSTNIGASGGSPPYSWSGTPPAGFTLTGGGTVSGTPTDTGAPFTVQVTDSKGLAASTSTSIPIAAALAVGSPCSSPNGCPVEQSCATVCGTYASVSGGVGPYQLVNYTALPPGTTPGVPSLAGNFAGLSPTGGPFQFTGDIVDSLGATQKVQAYFLVFPHVQLADGVACCNGSQTVVRMPITGGDGKISQVTFQNLPISIVTGKPLAVAVDPATTGSLLVLDIPTGYNPPLAPPFMVTLYDGSPCSPGANCSVQATVMFNLG